MNNKNILYIFTDASVKINNINNNKKINIGKASTAINFYINNKLILSEKFIISFRSTSNIAAYQAINQCFDMIINNIYILNNINQIYIFSDNKNTLDITSNIIFNKNEIYQKIKNDIYNKAIIINKPIIIQKCKSKQNNYNKKVDKLAKIQNRKININHINPLFISYDMIKKENKYLFYNINIQNWYNYINNTLYSKHFKLNQIIPEDFHESDLIYMNSNETSYLIQLYSSHINLNHFKYYKLKNINSPNCIFCKTPETIDHFLFKCNKYSDLIKSRNNMIKNLLDTNNLNYEIDYKLLCYSNKNLPQKIRIKIKKYIINYIILTNRFKH